MSVNRDLAGTLRSIAVGLTALDLDRLPPLDGLDVLPNPGSSPSTVALLGVGRSDANSTDRLRALVTWHQTIGRSALRADPTDDGRLLVTFEGRIGGVRVVLRTRIEDVVDPSWKRARQLAEGLDSEAAGAALVTDVLGGRPADEPPTRDGLCPGSGRWSVPGPAGNGHMCPVCRRGSRPLGMSRRAKMRVPDHRRT